MTYKQRRSLPTSHYLVNTFVRCAPINYISKDTNLGINESTVTSVWLALKGEWKSEAGMGWAAVASCGEGGAGLSDPSILIPGLGSLWRMPGFPWRGPGSDPNLGK